MRKFTSIVMLCSLVLTLAGGITAHAAENSAAPASSNSSKGTTATGQATFTVTPGPFQFRQPTDTKASSNLDFAFNDLNLGPDQKTSALKSSSDGQLMIDNFQGTGAPWEVNLQLSSLMRNAPTTKSAETAADQPMGGTTLNLTLGKVTSTDINQDSQAASQTPLEFKAGDDAKPLFTAPQGIDMDQVTIPLSNPTLEIPRIDYSGNYSATLTYTLTDTPAN